MNEFIDKIIAAVKEFEAQYPGLFITEIRLNEHGNIAERNDGAMVRISHLFEIDTIGSPNNPPNKPLVRTD